METSLTIIFGAIGAAIVVAAVGIAIYKWKYNLRADLSPRDKKAKKDE